MPGLTNLKETLKSMKVTCDGVEYGFASVVEENVISHQKVLATFKEDDKLAIIAPSNYLKSENIEYEGPFAKLTVEVHTSLDLVGLTAVVTAKLTENNIPANVVAAFYHDHIFVPYELRGQAKELLESLKDS